MQLENSTPKSLSLSVRTGIRKHLRKLASQFQLACLQAYYRVADLFEFLQGAFGWVRATHHASSLLPIHLLLYFLAYSL